MNAVEVKKSNSLTGHTDCVYSLEQGPEPDKIFSSAGDGMVVLWDLKNPDAGQLIARLANSVYAMCYIKSRGLLVVGHNHNGIHVLDWQTKKEVATLPLTAAAIFDIKTNGKDLFVAAGDGSVNVIDALQWKVLDRIMLSGKSARTIALNPVANEMAIGYSDHAIRVIDLDTHLVKYEWLAHQNSVFTLVYEPSGSLLLSGSRDARLKAWAPNNRYELTAEVAAHLFAINHIAYSPDAKHFVTCSLDKSIKVWDAKELRLLKVIDKSRHGGHGTSVNKLLWTTFDSKLVSASDDRTISIWDLIFNRE